VQVRRAPDKVIEPVLKTSTNRGHPEDRCSSARTYLPGLLLSATRNDAGRLRPAGRVYQVIRTCSYLTSSREFWQELRQRVFQALKAQIEHYDSHKRRSFIFDGRLHSQRKVGRRGYENPG